MKKSILLVGCNTYEEIVKRVAEILVWNAFHQSGYCKVSGGGKAGVRSSEWEGYCFAISSLFGDTNEEGESEFFTLVNEIRATVEAVGIDNYKWSWKKYAVILPTVRS